MRPKPLKTERRPTPRPIAWEQPEGTFPYRVKDHDTWESIARQFDVKSAQYLIFVNFYVYVSAKNPGSDPQHPYSTNEVNWYLREYVGCNVTKDGGKNWAFSNSANPGIIYIPIKLANFEGEGSIIVGSTGIGGKIAVPQYDDSNFYDTISKALDIYAVADTGIGVSEVALPTLVEAGLVVAGPIVSAIALFVGGGSGDNEALRYWNRDYFFEGFSIGLVMSANGAGEAYINRHKLQYPPLNKAYPEKAKTFQNLQNMGLMLGIQKGKQMNTVDKHALFPYLYSQLSASDRIRFDPKNKFEDWPEPTKKDYYDRLSSMVKQKMLDNNLELKLR